MILLEYHFPGQRLVLRYRPSRPSTIICHNCPNSNVSTKVQQPRYNQNDYDLSSRHKKKNYINHVSSCLPFPFGEGFWWKRFQSKISNPVSSTIKILWKPEAVFGICFEIKHPTNYKYIKLETYDISLIKCTISVYMMIICLGSLLPEYRAQGMAAWKINDFSCWILVSVFWRKKHLEVSRNISWINITKP